MSNTGKPLPLRHFTSRANLLSILESQSLRLSPTDNWIDKNDAASVAAYKRVTGAGDVRVLCLAQGREMVHHWFTYAPNDGCCIMLNAEKLLAQIDGQASFLHGHVTYFSRQDISVKMLRELPCEKLPFIKRRPYECEQEYRVIWSAAAPPQNAAKRRPRNFNQGLHRKCYPGPRLPRPRGAVPYRSAARPLRATNQPLKNSQPRRLDKPLRQPPPKRCSMKAVLFYRNESISAVSLLSLSALRLIYSISSASVIFLLFFFGGDTAGVNVKTALPTGTSGGTSSVIRRLAGTSIVCSIIIGQVYHGQRAAGKRQSVPLTKF